MTARGHDQRTQRDEPAGASPAAKTWKQLWCIHLQGTDTSLQHQNLLKKAGKEVLTSEVRGTVEALRPSSSTVWERGEHETTFGTFGRQWEVGKIGSHWERRWVHVWSIVAGGGGGRWWRFLGQNNSMDSWISYAEEEWIWWGHTIASRRRASGGVLPRGEKRMAKGKKSPAGDSFYSGRRERRRGAGSTCRWRWANGEQTSGAMAWR
jgi:hypothetical protein